MSANRSTAPSPMPRVPVVETPSCRAPATSAIPGPWSIPSSSTATPPPHSTSRSSRAPSTACLLRFTATSVTASSISLSRAARRPIRRPSSAAPRLAWVASVASWRIQMPSCDPIGSPAVTATT
ncbi:hypothetical protein KDL01_07360 [Actinospica durhamensis]|uniref:Uncharacterized protein n=1 Tax=Actinospica durhamensis TaxID=1508375 RepID=A0A941EIA4_9ACTN|nr:hypothetical protein [Actinospica durhamensis]MBR7833075.1 hypothetical protein [Actinospica durhamensis]